MAEINSILLESIWGVVLLGAFGSLLGVLLLRILKYCWELVPELKTRAVHTFMNLVGYEIEVSDKIIEELLPEDRHTKFHVYNSDLLQKLNHRFIVFIVLLVFSLYVYLTYGLSRPEILTVLIAITFFTCGAYLKLLLRYKLYMERLGFKSIENSVKDIQSERASRSIRIRRMLRESQNKNKP